MELRFNVPDDRIQLLKERTGLDTPTAVAREALGLLDWATRQQECGHPIVALGASGDQHHPPLPGAGADGYSRF